MVASGLKNALRRRFRTARAGLLRSQIAACPREGEALRILDVGGRIEYWREIGFDFLAAHRAEITLINIDDQAFTRENADLPPGFSLAVGDGTALPFADKSFDLCHSNSVIEHVGMWHNMAAFARETRRVGHAYFVQTPSYWFPIDPHFALVPFNHWLPRPMRAGLMRALPLATAGRAQNTQTAYGFVDSSLLLTRGQMQALFPEATMHAERLALLAKSWTAVFLPSPSQKNPDHG